MLLLLELSPDSCLWRPIGPVAWNDCAKFDSEEAAKEEAVRLALQTDSLTIRVKKMRRPPEAQVRWGIKDRRRGNWRFHPDPSVSNGWGWHIFDVPVKILTFATKAEAEGWLTMYRMATGEMGRVVAAPLDLARRAWGDKSDRVSG